MPCHGAKAATLPLSLSLSLSLSHTHTHAHTHIQEDLGSPALAFVRTLCALLALDARCTDAVSILRRQLLKLLKVREFSEAADFKEACLALTLPDVICRWVTRVCVVRVCL